MANGDGYKSIYIYTFAWVKKKDALNENLNIKTGKCYVIVHLILCIIPYNLVCFLTIP